jgi:hypothetical protein
MPWSVLLFCLSLLVFMPSTAKGQVVKDAGEQRSFGEFVQARAIWRDLQGSLYVVDEGANRSTKFSAAGDSLLSIGGYGWGRLEFDRPTGIFVSNGLDVFIADYGNHRIQRFNRKLEYIATLYTRESDNESQRFGYPTGVAVSRVGDVLVSDGENRRVLRFSAFTRFEQSIGGIDAGKGRLVEPLEVEVDDEDNIYVLEPKRVVVFDNFGNYVRTLGAGVLKDATGFTVSDRSLFIADGERIVQIGTDGKLLEVFDYREATGELAGRWLDVAASADSLYLLLPHTVVVIDRQERD